MLGLKCKGWWPQIGFWVKLGDWGIDFDQKTVYLATGGDGDDDDGGGDGVDGDGDDDEDSEVSVCLVQILVQLHSLPDVKDDL